MVRRGASHLAAALGLVLMVSPATSLILNEFEYCVKFFGSIKAGIELPDAIPRRNYDGSQICPRSWDFPVASGATLTLCPPDDSGEYWADRSNGLAIGATLAFHSLGGLLDRPVDNLKLNHLLVTNGSVTGPFENDGVPALLARDEVRSKRKGFDFWTVNGTEKSLIANPDINGNANIGVYFNCNNLPDGKSSQYCGGYEDIHEGGCWSSQNFLWTMKSPLNYTIRFSNSEASVEIWSADEYVHRNGTKTGSFSNAYIVFGGNRELPSVVDYDFWENAEANYETEMRDLNDMTLVDDGAGLPYFLNDTKSAEGYATRNGTFTVSQARTTRAWGSPGGLFVLAGALLCLL